MSEEIEKYLKKVANSYKPKRSKDPMENECLNCTMSQKSHQMNLPFACKEFK